MTEYSPDVRQRVESFCRRFELRVPILLAPMTGASSPSLSTRWRRRGDSVPAERY